VLTEGGIETLAELAAPEQMLKFWREETSNVRLAAAHSKSLYFCNMNVMRQFCSITITSKLSAATLPPCPPLSPAQLLLRLPPPLSPFV
jgi:hypothetical protein